MSHQLDLSDIATNTGKTLDELSHASPLLVVFLRHKGCSFCRQTLAELAQRRSEIEAAGAKIVLVHMIEDDNEAEMFFARWRLHDVPRVGDPQQVVYDRFGLQRGTLWQVLGLDVWWPGFKAVFLGGHVPGKPVGDVFQLPGAFLLHRGRVVQSFKSQTSAQKPDYVQLARPTADESDRIDSSPKSHPTT